MVIQQVGNMSKDTSAQSGQAAAPPNEAEYHAVYAAVTATERGRWFLAEFANRNRKADTDLVLAALARIEAAIQAGAAPQAVLADEATALAAAPAAVAPVPPSGGERDEPDAVVVTVAEPAPAPTETHQVAAADADKDYSDAVAAIAASLTTRLEESAKDLVEDAVEPARETEPQPQGRGAQAVSYGVSQDNSPRWHIESPDFVFGAAADSLDAGMIAAAPQRETPQHQSQLLGAEIMSEPIVPLAAARQDARQEPQSRLTPGEVAAVDSIVEAAIETPAAEVAEPPAISPPAVSPSALDVVPLVEISRPQLRIAREAMPVNARPPRFGSLTVTDALSEDEVIALFG
jgi:hypothetical protein